MAKGSYLGGHTVLRGPRGQVPRSPMRTRSSSTGPEHEKRKAALKEKNQATAKQIRQNEKLARKLSKQWQEERGRRLFTELTRKRGAERLSDALDRATATSPGRSLVHALKAALGERNARKENER